MIRHMSLSIKGALINWELKQFGGILEDDDGNTLDALAAKLQFIDYLIEGKEVLPMGDCEGFDYKTGCPGHE